MSRLAAGSGGGSTTGRRESPTGTRNLPDGMDPSTADLLLNVPATASGARNLSDRELITIADAIDVSDLEDGRSWVGALPKIAALQAQVINADIRTFEEGELLGFSKATLESLAQQRELDVSGTKRQIVDVITRDLLERGLGHNTDGPETNLGDETELGVDPEVTAVDPEVTTGEDTRPTSPWAITPDANAPEVRVYAAVTLNLSYRPHTAECCPNVVYLWSVPVLR